MDLQPVGGFTPDQRFFIGMAQWACGDERPENKRVNAITNPHSPDEYRINGVVANMPEFAAAFSCKAGQPMARRNVCQVWSSGPGTRRPPGASWSRSMASPPEQRFFIGMGQ